MSKSYKKIMDKIYVDDKMKARILQNIETKQTEKSNKKNNSKNIGNKRDIFISKKTSICAAAVLLIFCLAVPVRLSGIFDLKTLHQQKTETENLKDDASSDLKTSNKNSVSNADNTKTSQDSGNVDANTETLSDDEASEFAQYSSAKELSKNMGFQITDIPDKILPYKISEKVYYNYGNGLAEIQYVSEKAQYIVYRKQTGKNKDISEDYTEYNKTTTIKIHSINICLKGEKNKYNLATWSKGNYSYSLNFSDGITKNTFQNILKSTI